MDQSQKGKGPEAATLQLQEGSAENYFKALYDLFGGEISENSYAVNNATVRIRLDRFSVDPGMEILLTDAWYEGDILMERSPDGDMDFVHIYLLMEGGVNQAFEEKEVSVEASTVAGGFVYNGLFPMNIVFPAEKRLRSVAIKIRREAFGALLPEAMEMFTKLFSHPQGVAYHASIPAELEKICNEIHYHRDMEFGSRSMVIARGIEALTMVFDSVRKMREKNQLNGLHVEDFDRLQLIKNYILSHIDEKVSLENLASEFGISVSKLKRDFKGLFDLSVYQFYTHARMDEAYKRLKSGQYSVMEVGYDLGYQNLSKFSEMFKKIKGISPSEVI